MTAGDEPAEQMVDRAELAALPAGPGVYCFYERRGELLYIGQSATLRARVRSYFQPSAQHSRRRGRMVRAVRRIGAMPTECDLAARILESRLIRQRRPRYNVWLRTVRYYSFLRLDTRDPYPKLTVTDAPKADGARYFGPLRGKAAAQLACDTLLGATRLRICDGRLHPRADHPGCWYGEVGRCLRPCDGSVDEAGYAAAVARLEELLEGAPSGLVTALAAQRDALAEALQFEAAAELQRQLIELERVLGRRERISPAIDSHHVVVIDRGRAVLIAGGRYRGSAAPESIDAAALRATYGEPPPRGGRLTADDVDELRQVATWLAERRGARIVYVALPLDPDAVLAAIRTCR